MRIDVDVEMTCDPVELTDWPDRVRVFAPGPINLRVRLTRQDGRDRHLHGPDAQELLRLIGWQEEFKCS